MPSVARTSCISSRCPCSRGSDGAGMKRPLWVIGLAYAAGLLVAALAGLNTSLWLGVVCLLLLAGALLYFPFLHSFLVV